MEITTQKELMEWLARDGIKEHCCWVIVSVKPEHGKLMYLDAVEAALCYGWIDGIKKKISSTQTAQRLSPRAKRSSWTELNKERVRRLEKLGLMTDAGRSVLPDMTPSSFKVEPVIMQRIMADEDVHSFFNQLPPLYQRIRIDNIQSVKSDSALFQQRLDKFIDSLKQQKMYGQWNDAGRLIDY